MLKRWLSSGLIWLWVTAIVLVVDRATKLNAVRFLALNGGSISVFPHFRLTLAFNRGAAFSLLGSASGWQVWFFLALSIVASIVLLVLLAKTKSNRYSLCFGLALILGGAIGNGYDRLMYASVVDFIELYAGNLSWPIFNIADMAICFGVAGVILDGFKKRK